VNLSNNQIDDVSPLFDLPELEFCDISGNKVPPGQIHELEDLGISVCNN
jgi:Leucine-rich repeat (LRR) protein